MDLKDKNSSCLTEESSDPSITLINQEIADLVESLEKQMAPLYELQSTLRNKYQLIEKLILGYM